MLGAALTRRLLDEGCEVAAVVRPGSSRLSNIPSDERVVISETDNSELSLLPERLSAVGFDSCDAFFHFAWDGTFGASRNNMQVQIENIRASVDAVTAASRLGCECFVGAGSQAEYGRVPDGTKLGSKTPVNPETGYGAGKLCAGKMTAIKAAELEMRHVWMRILSTYGPLDGAHTMVMSGIGKMLRGETADYTKGEQLWDYLYCGDAADAFYLAALHGVSGKVYPLGSGNVRPLAEYIRAIRDACSPGLDIGLGRIDYYPSQVMYLCADISELTRDTGFVPKTAFEDGIRQTVDWYRREYAT